MIVQPFMQQKKRQKTKSISQLQQSMPSSIKTPFSYHSSNNNNSNKKISLKQLREQRLQLIHKLEQMNNQYSKIIRQRTEQEKNQHNQRQLKIYWKMCKNLRKQYESYNYMLTAEYRVQLDENLKINKGQLKKFKEQVNKLNKELSRPMEKEVKVCEELTRQRYQLEKEIQLAKVHLEKNRRILANNNRNIVKQKQTITAIKQQIQELKQSMGQVNQKEDQRKLQQRYKQLKLKEMKMKKLIISVYNNGKVNYAKKSLQIKQMNSRIREINETTENVVLKIQRKKIQYLQEKETIIQKQLQNQMIETKRRKIYSVSNKSYLLKGITKPNYLINSSFITKRSEDRRINSRKIHQIIPGIYKHNTKLQQNRKLCLNKRDKQLYNQMGKSKLLIEQDYNIKQLLYEGLNQSEL